MFRTGSGYLVLVTSLKINEGLLARQVTGQDGERDAADPLRPQSGRLHDYAAAQKEQIGQFASLLVRHCTLRVINSPGPI